MKRVKLWSCKNKSNISFLSRRGGVPVIGIPRVKDIADVYDYGVLCAAQLVPVGNELSGKEVRHYRS